MELNYVNGSIAIADVYDEFNIKSDDWVMRAPNWIYKALRHLRHINAYVDSYDENTFSDNQIILPEFINTIKQLVVNDQTLINNDHIINSTPTYNYSNTLYNISNNIITLEELSGTYKIWFKSIPLQFDDVLQIFIPKIPNKERTIENIKWFIFKNILSRGYVHPIYSLGNRNPEYDPNIKWQNTLRGARHDMSPMTLTEINRLSNIFNTFVSKPNFNIGQVVNNYEVNRRTS